MKFILGTLSNSPLQDHNLGNSKLFDLKKREKMIIIISYIGNGMFQTGILDIMFYVTNFGIQFTR